jgi:hypothetical protein
MPIDHRFDDLDLREEPPRDPNVLTDAQAVSRFACSTTCDSVYQCCV